ncbi:MAG: hypothetical protein A2V77_17260 [Anaeromyxobacter sp. RBG_16_69_14]|nr:MAG: hypothetical protein A2V77_17260 [Anaeromyxobacter sp. RBG_16_69_14]
MPSPRCPRCGRENEASLALCQGCGHALRSPDERRCSGCGSKIEPGFRFCGHCGLAVAEPPPPRPTEEPPPVLHRVARDAGPLSTAVQIPDSSLPQQAPSAGPWRGLRVVPVRHDGLPGAAHPFGFEGLVCGRTRGELRFADDATISPEHARLTFRGEAALVEDLGSLNGTFVRVRTPRPLASGDDIRVGRQLLRVEAVQRPPEGIGARPWGSLDAGHRARLMQLLDGGGVGEVFLLRPGDNAIGREAGQACFPSDRYVSARHARIDISETGMVLTDLGSSNGTFVRIRGPEQVVAGDQILIGMRLLRVEH